ncbi:hypothetical protein Sru01_10470 [Sphaerisporangium rufum]|uniref:Peptidase n=1 Tax=Sphaerisporangium rufum TaxID=1381558 RepID=A0A919V391_9ACTN|nr:hypothetical protein [Sphaerisporangium rufum]GII76065.1 hypothetical protein Sru01_10470 [Sphaerisporangium rufum]
MRALRSSAVLVTLLAGLTASAAATGLPPVIAPPPVFTGGTVRAPAVDAVIGERPEIWRGARVVRGRWAVVVGGRGAAPATLADLARRADRASRATVAILGLAGPPRPLVLVPDTTAQAATLAAPAAVSGLAALAATDRMIIEPESFARLTPTGRDVVLAHELTHLVTGAAADGRTPKWLVEGFADYVGHRDAGLPVPVAAAELAADVRAGRAPDGLPLPGDFAAGAPRLAQAYQEAWLACRYVAGRFGERTLVTLYRESMRGDVDAAARRTLGMTMPELAAAWRGYVREELS